MWSPITQYAFQPSSESGFIAVRWVYCSMGAQRTNLAYEVYSPVHRYMYKEDAKGQKNKTKSSISMSLFPCSVYTMKRVTEKHELPYFVQVSL